MSNLWNDFLCCWGKFSEREDLSFWKLMHLGKTTPVLFPRIYLIRFYLYHLYLYLFENWCISSPFLAFILFGFDFIFIIFIFFICLAEFPFLTRFLFPPKNISIHNSQHGFSGLSKKKENIFSQFWATKNVKIGGLGDTL